ncbi:hypothetical protein BH24GEM3_BH24GEM3_17210 [soil metagenome]
MRMASFSAAERERRAAELLRELGVECVRVEAAGHQGEIAALSAPAGELERLLGEQAPTLAADLRALGFRYVALDLEDAEDDDPTGGGAE